MANFIRIDHIVFGFRHFFGVDQDVTIRVVTKGPDLWFVLPDY